MRYILFCVLGIFTLSCAALGDEVITLQLETPGFEKTTPKADAKTAQAVAVTTVTTRTVQKQQTVTAAVITAPQASIYASQSTKSRVYSVCGKGTSLAIVRNSGSWCGVLMADGSTGWIQSSKIEMLDYTAEVSSGSRGAYASRGAYDGRQTSENPIVQTALQYLGVPYVYGGNSPSNGMDCSAFVKRVYAEFGVNLPRVSRDQANVGTPVPWDNIQPGDRLYFACKHSYVDHCGIYIGNGYFIHASASRGGVGIDSLSSKFYSQSLVAIMR